MPRDWQRAVVTLAATVVAVTVILTLYLARSVLIPVALAIFLAFVLGPLVTRLQRWGLGRTPAVVLTVGLVVVASLGAGTLIAQQVSGLMETLPDRADAIKAKVATAKLWIAGNGTGRFNQLVDEVTALIAPNPQTPAAVLVEPSTQSLSRWFGVYLSPAAEFVGQAMFAFVLTVYVLIRREDLRNRFIRLVGDGNITTTTKATDEASRRISRYLLMQFLLNIGFGIVITLALLLLGVDYALLWGFIAAVMRYVPYVGTWIGLVPPVLFSFATAPDWGGGWGQPIAVLVLFGVLEALCNNVFEPYLYGQSMGLSEVAQLVAAATWAFLWGPIGLILSGPLTVCLLVLGKHVRRFKFLDVLLGDEPPLAPHVAFYQRLAARDQDEAAEIALKAAREKSPAEAIEQVVIPALCLAHQDADDGDLDQATLQYVIRGAREVAAEVTEQREPHAVSHDNVRVGVLIVAARDEADHVAADILARTLDPTRWEARVAGDEMLASELLATVEEERPAVVVLLTLPPGGLSHCRYLVSRLRAKCPDVRILAGRWGENLPENAGVPQVGIKGVDATSRTLSETQKQLAELQPVLAATAATAEKSSPEPLPVGTLNA